MHESRVRSAPVYELLDLRRGIKKTFLTFKHTFAWVGTLIYEADLGLSLLGDRLSHGVSMLALRVVSGSFFFSFLYISG